MSQNWNHPTPSPTLATTLGVGAGGNILQVIEEDSHDPRVWGLANSKLLNIQIIVSSTFRLLTGLDPPPTPVTAKTYEDLGLPFFSLWCEHDTAKGKSVAGTWKDIKGMAETD